MDSIHETIVKHFKDSDTDYKRILELNELKDFSECVLKDAVVRKKNGHPLKGVSLNTQGLNAAKDTRKLEEKRTADYVKQTIKELADYYRIQQGVDPLLKIMVFSLETCKSKYDIDQWLKSYSQYFVGRKSTIADEENQNKKLVIQIGSDNVSAALRQLTEKLSHADYSGTDIEFDIQGEGNEQ